MIHDPGAQKQRIGRIVEFYIELFRELRPKYAEVSDEHFLRAFQLNAGLALSEEFTFFKAPAFEEEHEWRLAIMQSAGIFLRERAGVLTPYAEIDIRTPEGQLPLHKIFVSPLGDQELSTHAAQLLLRESG